MMNVPITKPELEKIVHDKVSKGEYGSAEEVVEAALLLLEQDRDENLPSEELAELRGEIMKGANQADRGEFVEFTAEDIIREETRRLSSRNGK